MAQKTEPNDVRASVPNVTCRERGRRERQPSGAWAMPNRPRRCSLARRPSWRVAASRAAREQFFGAAQVGRRRTTPGDPRGSGDRCRWLVAARAPRHRRAGGVPRARARRAGRSRRRAPGSATPAAHPARGRSCVRRHGQARRVGGARRRGARCRRCARARRRAVAAAPRDAHAAVRARPRLRRRRADGRRRAAGDADARAHGHVLAHRGPVPPRSRSKPNARSRTSDCAPSSSTCSRCSTSSPRSRRCCACGPGRFAEAEALAMASHGLGVETGDADAGASYLSQLIAIRWMQGRAAELLGDTEEIEHATTIVHAYADYVWPIIAVLAAVADQRDRARAALDRILVVGAAHRCPNRARGCRRCSASRKSRTTSTIERRRIRSSELLEPYASLPMVGSLGVVCFGAAARSLGLARRTLGDLDGAVAALDDAVRQNRRIGHLPMLAIARADLAADARPRATRPGDRERARAVRRRDRSGRARWTCAHAPRVAERVGKRWMRHGAPGASMIRKRRALGGRTRRRGRDRVRQRRHGLPRDAARRVPHEDVRAALLAGAVEEQGAAARARRTRTRGVPQASGRAPARDRRSRRVCRHRTRRGAPGRVRRAARGADPRRAARRPVTRAFTDADERARTSVQKALRRAIAAIGAGAPRPRRRADARPSAPAPSAASSRTTSPSAGTSAVETRIARRVNRLRAVAQSLAHCSGS